MKIKAILQIVSSKPDASNNTYWAFRYTSTETAVQVEALCDHESNLLAAIYDMHGSTEYFWYKTELPKRIFKAQFGACEYAGCKPEDIKWWIIRHLESKTAALKHG